MDDETKAAFIAMEARIAALQAALDALTAPRPTGETICLKEAVARSGYSRHTLVWRALTDPSLGEKVGGRWKFSAQGVKPNSGA